MAPSRNDVVPSQEINICNLLCRSGNSSTLGSLGEQSQHMGIGRQPQRKKQDRRACLRGGDWRGNGKPGRQMNGNQSGPNRCCICSSPI